MLIIRDFHRYIAFKCHVAFVLLHCYARKMQMQQDIQGDSKLLSRFPWPIFFKIYVKRKHACRCSEFYSIDSIYNKIF
jgi:hypothetical protein